MNQDRQQVHSAPGRCDRFAVLLLRSGAWWFTFTSG